MEHITIACVTHILFDFYSFFFLLHTFRHNVGLFSNDVFPVPTPRHRKYNFRSLVRMKRKEK